jgi:hypothetical protein
MRRQAAITILSPALLGARPMFPVAAPSAFSPAPDVAGCVRWAARCQESTLGSIELIMPESPCSTIAGTMMEKGKPLPDCAGSESLR